MRAKAWIVVLGISAGVVGFGVIANATSFLPFHVPGFGHELNLANPQPPGTIELALVRAETGVSGAEPAWLGGLNQARFGNEPALVSADKSLQGTVKTEISALSNIADLNAPDAKRRSEAVTDLQAVETAVVTDMKEAVAGSADAAATGADQIQSTIDQFSSIPTGPLGS